MMISFARAGPTRRTNRVVDATPRGTPRSTSGIQSCASAAAQRKSQASVRPHPPPTAWPLIMAIIVLARSKSRRNWLFRWPKASRRSSGDMADLRRASAPAENTGGAPVTMTTRVAASSRSSANAVARSVSIASLSELRRSGRFNVTVAIAPSRASVTFSPMRADGITGRATGAITSRPRERPASGARLCEEPERRLRGPEAREKRRGRRAEMTRRDLGEQGAEVRRHGEVTALEELVAGEPGPAPVHAAAAHTAAENEHRRRMTVVGPPVAVLCDGPAELRHRDHDDVRHLAAEVLSEGRERPPELAEAERELPALGALADVGIPALHVGERDLEADARLDELGDLAQRLAELAAWIIGAVRRRDAQGVGAPEHLHRLEGLAPRPMDEITDPLLVERLESLPRAPVGAGADVEALDGLHRDCAHVTLERPRERRAHRDRAEWCLVRRPRLDRAGQPAVGRALDPRRPGLHVVLGVEMRARRVRRAASVDHREGPVLPERHQRSERGVQSEEAVEVDRAVGLATLRRLEPDRRTPADIAGLAVGHHHAKPVHGATLEHGHQHLAVRLRYAGCPQEESRRRRVGDQGASAGLQERPPRGHRMLS